jgi:hypothetical protein
MSLTGLWHNELKSGMLLIEDANNGLTGYYHSFVGRDKGVRKLAGRTHVLDGSKRMVGFAVCFEIANPGPTSGNTSLCTWSGWYTQRDHPRGIIKTHWHLSLNELDPKDEWAGNMIGEDWFVKFLDDPREDVIADEAMFREYVAKNS